MSGTDRLERGAFSLVEVVLALGVIAFALIAVIGLLSMSLRTGKAANEDMLLPMMAGSVIEEMRSTSFEDLLQDFPEGKVFWFDSQGVLNPPDAGRVFRCEIKWSARAPSAGEDLSVQMRRAILTFNWPPGATNQSFTVPVSLVDMGDRP